MFAARAEFFEFTNAFAAEIGGFSIYIDCVGSKLFGEVYVPLIHVSQCSFYAFHLLRLGGSNSTF